MTQTTTSPSGPAGGHSSDPGRPTPQPDSAAAPHPSALPYPEQPAGGPVPPPLPPAGIPPTDADRPTPTAPERRPTWRGVIAVGAGAAVLSSLLTAGLTSTVRGDTTPAPSSAAAAAPQQSAPPVVTDTATQPDWVAVAAAVEPSVVSVQLNGPRGPLGEGSGVVLDDQGHVLTNNHVVAAAGSGAEISIVLSDGRSYAATVVGTDPSTDLAVIDIGTPPSDLKPATFGDSEAVRVGDPVMALGNPLGLSDTVTTGIVSALDRPVTTSGEQQNQFGGTRSEPVVTNAIQTDAAVNPGNSGGALVDGQGRVIGITSSIASLGSSLGGSAGSIGLGFAIPANEAMTVASELMDNGTVQHAYLGVGLTDGVVQTDSAQRRAALVAEVSPDTPAATAGLRADDAVIALNGEPLDGAESLIARVRAARPGDQVTLTVVRDGNTQQIAVTLAVRPTG